MDITVTAGESAVLRCDVGGFPRPRMAWIKNGESMRNSSRIQMTMNAVQSAVMTFSETRVSDGGEYICTATNDAGSAQESGTLTVQGMDWVLFIKQECFSSPWIVCWVTDDRQSSIGRESNIFMQPLKWNLLFAIRIACVCT